MFDDGVLSKIVRAGELKREGKTLREIAMELGVSESSAWRYLNYEKNREQKAMYRKKKRIERLRRESGLNIELAKYRYICSICGGVINKGDEAVKGTFATDSEAYYTYSHLKCITPGKSKG